MTIYLCRTYYLYVWTLFEPYIINDKVFINYNDMVNIVTLSIKKCHTSVTP